MSRRENQPAPGSPCSPMRRHLLASAGLLGAGVSPAALGLGSGATAALPAALRAVTRGAPDFELWRQAMMWQYRKSPRAPQLIVQAQDVDDVVATVRYARQAGLRLTTRAGGHSMSACFLRDNGILLDVSRLDGISVDPARREVSVGPGVLGRALNERLRPHGLAFPTAHCGMVPLSGFLLGGGIGWNSNAWGAMGAFNIKAVDMVTADGRRRRVDAQQHPDLLWAVRGGGPGLFGVVTRFHLQCHALPRAIHALEFVFKVSDLPTVAAAVSEMGQRVDLDVELLTVLERVRPEHAEKVRSPDDGGQAVFLFVMVFADDTAALRRKLQPVLAHPVLSLAVARSDPAPETFETLYQGNEIPFPQKRWQADNIYTNRPVDAARLIQSWLPRCPSDGNAIVLQHKGNPKLPDAACSTTGEFYFSYYMVWDRAEQDQAQNAYHLAFFKEARALASGSYINEFNQEGRPQDIPDCYTPAAWRRLAELRARWDPTGVFHDFFGRS